MAEFVMDEKTKKMLLGYMPYSQNGTMDFTPKEIESLPNEVRPVFKQRAFTRGEIQKIRDTSKMEITEKIYHSMELARPTVLGWEKVFDLATGTLIAFKADADAGADKDLWASLPDYIKLSLYHNCSIMSGISTQEKQGLK